MSFRRVGWLLAASAAALVLAGGGSGNAGTKAAKPPAATRRAMIAVVHAWSKRLNAGDYAGIAELFSVPAVIVQPPYVYRLQTRQQVALWHSGLPCAGTVLSVDIKGRYATAVFQLGNRKGHRCDAPGQLAAARFEIVNGKIRSWVQVPVPKNRQGGGVA
jgi:hypothetical protein